MVETYTSSKEQERECAHVQTSMHAFFGLSVVLLIMYKELS